METLHIKRIHWGPMYSKPHIAPNVNVTSEIRAMVLIQKCALDVFTLYPADVHAFMASTSDHSRSTELTGVLLKPTSALTPRHSPRRGACYNK